MSLHEKVMELQGNIRVFTRCRPLILEVDNLDGDLDASIDQSEASSSSSSSSGEKVVTVQSADPNMMKSLGWGEEVVVKDLRGYDTKTKLKFEYDVCFPPTASQESVFAQVR
jgi:hypothetical protein